MRLDAVRARAVGAGLRVELLAWERGAWTQLDNSAGGCTGQNAAASDAPTSVAWCSPDAASAQELLMEDGGALHFAIAPLATNGMASARIDTDYVELRVRYSLP